MPEEIDGIYLNAYLTEAQIDATSLSGLNRDREIVYVTDWAANAKYGSDSRPLDFTPAFQIDFEGTVYRRNIVTWEALLASGGSGIKHIKDGDTDGSLFSDDGNNNGVQPTGTEEYMYQLGNITNKIDSSSESTILNGTLNSAWASLRGTITSGENNHIYKTDSSVIASGKWNIIGDSLYAVQDVSGVDIRISGITDNGYIGGAIAINNVLKFYDENWVHDGIGYFLISVDAGIIQVSLTPGGAAVAPTGVSTNWRIINTTTATASTAGSNNFIGSGIDNTIRLPSDDWGTNAIITGSSNTISSSSNSVILGGNSNTVTDGGDSYTFIGSGENNYINSPEATIVSGRYNRVVVSVAGQNLESPGSIIGGGFLNTIYGVSAGFIGSGAGNSVINYVAGSQASLIVGGTDNTIEGASEPSYIGAGNQNSIGTQPFTSSMGIASGGYITSGNPGIITFSPPEYPFTRTPVVDDSVRFSSNRTQQNITSTNVPYAFVDGVAATPDMTFYIESVTGNDITLATSLGGPAVAITVDNTGFPTFKLDYVSAPIIDTINNADTFDNNIVVGNASLYTEYEDIAISAGSGTLPTGLVEGTYTVSTIDTVASTITLFSVTITAAGVGTSNVVKDIEARRPIASAIVSGENNYLIGPYSYIGGGRSNTIYDATSASIVNGERIIIASASDTDAYASSIFSTVVNGYQHQIINGPYSTIINGSDNKISDDTYGNSAFSTIINGDTARIHASVYSLICGGEESSIGYSELDAATLAWMGFDTSYSHTSHSVILNGEGAGSQNIYAATSSLIGVGYANTIWGLSSSYSTILSGHDNQNIGCSTGFIGAGTSNRISALALYDKPIVLYSVGDGTYMFEWPYEVMDGSYSKILVEGDYISFNKSGGVASTDIIYGHNYIISSVFISGGVTRFKISVREPGESYATEISITDPGSGGVTYTASTHSQGYGASIITGMDNQATSSLASIVSGIKNKIGADSTYSSILNGQDNYINRAVESIIGSGVGNAINNTPVSAIITGENNYIGTDELTFSAVGENTGYSTILGGENNTIDGLGRYGFIDGGYKNTLTGTYHGAIISSRNSIIKPNNGALLIDSYDTIIGSKSATIDLGGGGAIHNTIIGSANSGMTGNGNNNYIYFGSVTNSEQSWIISDSDILNNGTERATINNSFRCGLVNVGQKCESNEIHNSSSSALGAGYIGVTDGSSFSDESGTLAIDIGSGNLPTPYPATSNIIFMPTILQFEGDTVTGLTYGETYTMTLVSGTTKYKIDSVSYASLVITGTGTPTFQYVLAAATQSISNTRILNSTDVYTTSAGNKIQNLEVSNSKNINIGAAVNSTITGSFFVELVGNAPEDVNLINSKDIKLRSSSSIFGANLIGNGIGVNSDIYVNSYYTSMINVDNTGVFNSDQSSLMNSYNDSVNDSSLSTLINTLSCELDEADTSTIINAIGCTIKDTVTNDGQPLSAIFNSQFSSIDVQGAPITDGYKLYNIQFGVSLIGESGTDNRWNVSLSSADVSSSGGLSVGDSITLAEISGVYPSINLNDYASVLNATHVITHVDASIQTGRTLVWFVTTTPPALPPSRISIITGGTLGVWDNATAPAPSGGAAAYGNTIIGANASRIEGLSSNHNLIISGQNNKITANPANTANSGIMFGDNNEIGSSLNSGLISSSSTTLTGCISTVVIGSNNTGASQTITSKDNAIVLGNFDVADIENDTTHVDNLLVKGVDVKMGSLPTSAPATAGYLWNDSGTIKISL